MNLQLEIIRITASYLDDTIDYLKLSTTTQEYKKLLYSLADTELDNYKGRQHIYMENGKAIGPLWAAMCLDDIMRTRQFVRGINKAIADKLAVKKEPLHILYAGTGPFATLILPLIFRYPKEKIKYTFLEVNPISYELVQKIMAKLDVEGYSIQFVQADATKFELGKDNLPDIIVSETMQNMLRREQQVPIFMNLMKQAKEDTVFIPEKINLYLASRQSGISISELNAANYTKLDKVLEISKDILTSKVFKETTTSIKKEQTIGYKDILVLTEIQVYKDEVIDINQSGLTVPLTIGLLSGSNTPQEIKTRYILGNAPKLEYKIS